MENSANAIRNERVQRCQEEGTGARGFRVAGPRLSSDTFIVTAKACIRALWQHPEPHATCWRQVLAGDPVLWRSIPSYRSAGVEPLDPGGRLQPLSGLPAVARRLRMGMADASAEERHCGVRPGHFSATVGRTWSLGPPLEAGRPKRKRKFVTVRRWHE